MHNYQWFTVIVVVSYFTCEFDEADWQQLLKVVAWSTSPSTSNFNHKTVKYIHFLYPSWKKKRISYVFYELWNGYTVTKVEAGGVGGGDDGEMSCCGCCRKEQQLNEFDSLSGWWWYVKSVDSAVCWSKAALSLIMTAITRWNTVNMFNSAWPLVKNKLWMAGCSWTSH